MRASDADRDAVVSDLSEHFQAGRLTAAELDERTGRALTARTWGELAELAADLPAPRPAAPPATPAGRPQPPARHTAPATAALAGLAIAAVILVHAVHGGWGLIWLLWPALLIARRAFCHCGTGGLRGGECGPVRGLEQRQLEYERASQTATEILAGLSPAQAAELTGQVRDSLAPYASPEGVVMPGAAWLVSAQAV